jgi:hypothetical protein
MSLEQDIKNIENKIKLLKVFYRHSVKGFKCSFCEKFIPNSYDGNNCPYPKCNAKIDKNNLIQKKHPITFSKRHIVYMNNLIKVKDGSNGGDFSEIYCDNGKNNAYELLSNEQEKLNNFKTIIEIIKKQKSVNGKTRKIPIKFCMYEAFECILKEFPEEMSSYLLDGGQNKDTPIQSLIFQKFVDMMDKKLPIIFFSKGNKVEINSLLDDRLHIFNGKRKFINFIDHNLIIKKKNQKRILESGEEVDDKSNHFLGKIISIQDLNGNNLINCVDSYSFFNIKIKNYKKIKPGIDVVVEYYSLKPSYTLGSMIHVQRIKRKLSESINRKLKNDK